VIAQSALLLSGLIVYWVTIPNRIVGWLADAGVLGCDGGAAKARDLYKELTVILETAWIVNMTFGN